MNDAGKNKKDDIDSWYKRYMEAINREIRRIDSRKQSNRYTIYIASSDGHIRYYL